ncbi:MAG TPA: GNAT family N-acetyltransferase [Candidatus Dormibacteraeota bacterium]|nr:GNAT family N-acetyltransferase [Candidatus Dormibacteraeota bacterium]
MTSPATDVEPACPEQDAAVEGDASRAPATRPRTLRAERRPFADIDRSTWDALAARNPWATPFSAWAFHRAWWDGYGANAHDDTLVVIDIDAASDAPPVAIAPFMHRHELEPEDVASRTAMRGDRGAHLTPVPATAKAVFMGASYHADYATILASPAEMPAVAEAVVARLADPAALAEPSPIPWDVVDLRRLRCGDSAADDLAAAFGAREMTAGWTVNIEREDVCPIATLPEGGDFEVYLSTLGKKERHEIRRKLRRAQAIGPVRLVRSPDPLADLEAFIDLHQRRWGEEGLFRNNAGGEQSRGFFRRQFELFGPDGPLVLSFLWVGVRRIAASVHFDDGESIYYYNAGVDPDARELSPGVLLVAELIRGALELGRRRLDFCRGDEAYKYEWGAVDESIQRLLVRRTERNDESPRP